MPSKAFLHLTAEGVVAIHGVVLKAHGGAPGVRDQALLESAVAAPQATFGGEPLMKSGWEIAAACLFYLCRNDAFVDGNKRTALASCLVFLESSGLLPDPGMPARDVEAWEALVLDVAASKLDRAQTTARLRRLVAARRQPRARKKKR